MVDNRLIAESDPHQSVFALGDCAQVRGHPLPCTAQVAERQGRYLAAAIAHKPTDKNPLPDEFVFKPMGMLAYVGGYKAIHDTPIDKSQGNFFINVDLFKAQASFFLSVCVCVCACACACVCAC